MKIADVLAHKGTRIETLWTNHTLGDALRLFDERRVSSVVITDPDGTPRGLLTDRDAVHAIARHEGLALAEKVTRAMTCPVPSCAPETTVTEAMRRMSDGRTRHLVVMDSSRMAGIVSIGDLVKARLDEAELEGRVLRDLALSKIAAE